MYVIRPQFFIPMITLLRNAAQNSLKYKTELAIVKAQNIDIANFEDELNNFKDAFGKNYELASRKFQTAIDEIDKSIDHLQKTKEALIGTDRNLRLANEIENLPDALPTTKIVTDDDGSPVDYIFLEINGAFEEMTGLKREKIIGKKVTEILPGIEKSEFDWIGTYGKVALSGEPVRFESFSEPLGHWYDVSAYSDKPGYFAVTFHNTTSQKQLEKGDNRKQKALPTDCRYPAGNDLPLPAGYNPCFCQPGLLPDFWFERT
jgi:PAS domain S-box-containing protein